MKVDFSWVLRRRNSNSAKQYSSCTPYNYHTHIYDTAHDYHTSFAPAAILSETYHIISNSRNKVKSVLISK